MNFKDRTKISASLFINLAEHIPLNNHTFGYVVDKNSLLDQKNLVISNIISVLFSLKPIIRNVP